MNLMNQGPAAQNFSFLQQPLGSIIGDNGLGAFNEFMAAAQPQFQRNLNFGLGALNAAAPAANSSAFGLQGIDATTQALQDFNLFAQQARLGFLEPSMQAAGLLTQAAGAAGQENVAQAINPTTQLMNTLFGGAYQPGMSEVVQTGTFMDFLTQGILGATGLIPHIGPAAGFLGGLFGGGGNTTQGTGNINRPGSIAGGRMFR